jgi:hypothetical protein
MNNRNWFNYFERIGRQLPTRHITQGNRKQGLRVTFKAILDEAIFLQFATQLSATEEGHNLGITAGGGGEGVSLFCPTKRAWPNVPDGHFSR